MAQPPNMNGDRYQHHAEHQRPNFEKPIPIISSPSLAHKTPQPPPRNDDAMDVSPAGPAPMGPPPLLTSTSSKSASSTATAGAGAGGNEPAVNGSSAPPTGAAAATQQPKVVQTAFIHKLYK